MGGSEHARRGVEHGTNRTIALHGFRCCAAGRSNREKSGRDRRVRTPAELTLTGSSAPRSHTLPKLSRISMENCASRPAVAWLRPAPCAREA